MHEADLIRQLAACFRRSPRQRNEPFCCDAEIVDLGGSLWGVTTDAFSPDEDCFGCDEPERLGHNVAVATLSDLLAAGCRPQFYLHSLDLPPGGEAFGVAFCRGVAATLDACGAYLLGGDLGCASAWRCAATALGAVARPEPLTRLLPPCCELSLYVTGTLGDANAAALNERPPPAFELRLDAAEALRACASACIDTSDGLASALWQLQAVNPGMRVQVDPEALPYAPEALDAAARRGLPREAFAFGGAGEYELLFAADADAQVPHATRIGTVFPHPEGGVLFGARALRQPPPDPRAFPDRPSYLAAVLSCAAAACGQGAGA